MNTVMVLEVATILVTPGQESAFEEAIAQAYSCLEVTEGYLGHTLRRCIETPNQYLLTIQWTSLEAHTVTFRESDNFVQWREIIGPFFAEPPSVVHYNPVHISSTISR